jgi:hypothetical protein
VIGYYRQDGGCRESRVDVIERVGGESYRLLLHRHCGVAWRACEDALLRGGGWLPLPARAEAGLWSQHERWLLEVRHGDVVVAAASISVRPTRALPGHVVLIVDRLGGATDANADRAALAGLLEVARSQDRVLRLELRLFARDPERLRRLRGWAQELQLSVAETHRGYRETLCIELAGRSEDELWAALHKKARRDVRVVDKHPVELEAITDPAEAPKLDALLAEAMQRTGGAIPQRDWRHRISVARDHPDLVRIVGLYRPETRELLAFAAAHNHGDHVEYADAGSARPSDLRIPLGYAPAWALLRWAREVGAGWFDFGGVTRGSQTEQAASSSGGKASDPLAGISDFKRYFRGELIEVAEEWTYEPSTVRALVAAGATEGAKIGRRALAAVDSALHRSAPAGCACVSCSGCAAATRRRATRSAPSDPFCPQGVMRT